MDITKLMNVGSRAIADAADKASTNTGRTEDSSFSSMFNAALSNLSETNSLPNKQDEEEIKFALGITENTHDLSIAAAKASTALSYTVALRDKFIEAYKEIMQMQI